MFVMTCAGSDYDKSWYRGLHLPTQLVNHSSRFSQD
ncbi:hypothetical protein FPSE_08709 [Fusarium pseudograminearum CS3096]|uniref:Uncharacterized protein n=1 Tax=Fusarium pseudograminearum (strain CS3096) TaxID=1028729 RepID=K3VES9_FUSPC|nr:hypothetical protein FPSE_08709 [Fusarium pseudograminearum CS3096]EKJ71203.1 hypothetical protein FPSE_08709 [Fusarium pseudograminearum CS3096]